MSATLPFDRSLFHPGQRIAVALSGGADSVALLRALHAARADLGIVLSAVHVHHGIRGLQADADRLFVAALAQTLDIPLRLFAADAPARAQAERETLEEAARHLRYGFFRTLLEAREADAVATAHTLDDQAETVLMKLLRGAWTEGLAGIHPVLACAPGNIVRPLLAVPRSAIEHYLLALNQPWREDETNADPSHTRNRIRHDLLPILRGYNPQIARQLSRLATVARDEEAWWQAELARSSTTLLLPGKPVRGGGRTASQQDSRTLSIEIERLRALHPAVRRRLLRLALARFGVAGDFDTTERLLAFALPDSDAPRHSPRASLSISSGLVAERTPRELRLSQRDAATDPALPDPALPDPAVYPIQPGIRLEAPDYGLSITASWPPGTPASATGQKLVLRPWRPGDRITLRHSRGPRKVADVLDRLHITGEDRRYWPVVALGDAVIWMRGADADPGPSAAGLQLEIEPSAAPNPGNHPAG